MDGNPAAFADSISGHPHAAETVAGNDPVVEFYEEAGRDYLHWSRGFNMHLGFYRPGLNPFDREAMLEQLNLEVAARLQISSDGVPMLIDLGCGVGAITRTIAKEKLNTIIKAVTIVPSQVKIATELNAREGLQERIEMLTADHTALPVDEHSADGVWAVESACYAAGASKKGLVREMARVLKNGGRFVVADCFLKRPSTELNWLVKKCYSTVCQSWALPEMPVLEFFVDTLERHRFSDIVIEDISWRVAPSLAHAPSAVATFILTKLLSGEPLKRHSINNLRASLLASVLGMNRSKFSYCLISGKLVV